MLCRYLLATVLRDDNDETQYDKTALQPARPTLPNEFRASNLASICSPLTHHHERPQRTPTTLEQTGEREAPPRVTLTTRRHCCMRRCTGATLLREATSELAQLTTAQLSAPSSIRGCLIAPWPSSWTSLEALTARFDSRGYQVDGRLRLRVEGAGRYFSNSLPQLPAVERLPRAKNEVWILGPQTPVGGRRATRVDVPAA
eukprot:scaffold20708_cov33-Phaeocystis_antarctica.AAC.2